MCILLKFNFIFIIVSKIFKLFQILYKKKLELTSKLLFFTEIVIYFKTYHYSLFIIKMLLQIRK